MHKLAKRVKSLVKSVRFTIQNTKKINKTLVKINRGTISTHRLNVPDDEKMKPLLHVLGKIKRNTGLIYMNRNHQRNTLTNRMIDELQRYIQSYEMDDQVRVMWIQNQNSNTFSKGLDFKSMHYWLTHNEPHEAYNYLRKVYDFAVTVGKLNKPLVACLDGELTGSSATIFTSVPFALSTKMTKWRLNEIDFGYIPDSGASFHLSRLPHELGAYFALTGKPLSPRNLAYFGITKGTLRGNLNYELNAFEEDAAYKEELPSSLRLFGDHFAHDYSKTQRDNSRYNKYLGPEVQARLKPDSNGNRENTRLAIADILYRKKLTDHANDNFSAFNKNSRLYYSRQPLANNLEYFEETVIDEGGMSMTPSEWTDLPLDAITRCFSANSIEEILYRLDAENTEWARETAKILRKKSPMALKLTLKLLREGLKSEWAECIQREFRVACRRLNDQDVQRAIQSQLSRFEDFNDWTHKKLEDITTDDVNRYFKPLKDDLGIEEYDPQIKSHSFVPVKTYYKEIPDKIRLWLNEESIKDFNLRMHQMFDVKTYLFSKGIDIRNPSLTIQLMREKIFCQEEYRRKLKLKAERVNELIHKKENIENYFKRRDEYIENWFADTDKAQQNIYQLVLDIFEKEFDENFNRLQDSYSKVRLLEKKKFFSNIKDIILKKRLIKTLDKLVKPPTSAGIIPLFFPKNPYDSHLDVPNPEIDPLHPYTKYIKQLKRHNKVSPEYFKEVLEGTFEKEILSEIKLDDNFPDEKVPPLSRAAEFIQNNVSVDPKLQFRMDEYHTIWGKSPEEIKYEEYSLTHLENLVSKKKNELKELLGNNSQSQTNLQDLLKQYTNGTLYSKKLQPEEYISSAKIENITYEEKVEIPNVESQTKALLATANAENNNKKKSLQSIQLDDILNTENLIDLNLNLKKDNLSGMTLDSLNKMNKGEANETKYYEYQLLKILNLDVEIANRLKEVLYPDGLENKGIKNVCKTLNKLLLTIYQKKIQQLLKNEIQKYNVGRPLFAKDNYYKSVINNETLEENERKFMEHIDDFLNNNLLYEFHSYLSSHLWLTFSYLALYELETLYSKLHHVFHAVESNKKILFDKRSNKTEFDYKAMADKLAEIDIHSEGQLYEFCYFLNGLCNTLGDLYHKYKEYIHFSEDKILEKYINLKAELSLKRGAKKRPSFTQCIIRRAYLNIRNSKTLQRLTYPQIRDPSEDPEILRLGMLDKEMLVRAKNYEYLQQLFQQTQKYYRPASTVYKHFIPGSLQYLVELDSAVQKGIYGKDYAFPDYFEKLEELGKIPDYFEEYDLREPIEAWFERKLKNVISQLLKVREKYQYGLTKDDLVALDYDLLNHLTPENIKESITQELQNDKGALLLYHEAYHVSNEIQDSQDLRSYKTPIMQNFLNNKIKNPDALNKFTAYSLRLYNKNKIREEQSKSLRMPRDKYILNRLLLDAYLPPEKSLAVKTKELSTKPVVKKLTKEDIAERLRSASKNDLTEEITKSLQSIYGVQSKIQGNKSLKDELSYFFRALNLSSDKPIQQEKSIEGATAKTTA